MWTCVRACAWFFFTHGPLNATSTSYWVTWDALLKTRVTWSSSVSVAVSDRTACRARSCLARQRNPAGVDPGEDKQEGEDWQTEAAGECRRVFVSVCPAGLGEHVLDSEVREDVIFFILFCPLLSLRFYCTWSSRAQRSTSRAPAALPPMLSPPSSASDSG